MEKPKVNEPGVREIDEAVVTRLVHARGRLAAYAYTNSYGKTLEKQIEDQMWVARAQVELAAAQAAYDKMVRECSPAA